MNDKTKAIIIGIIAIFAFLFFNKILRKLKVFKSGRKKAIEKNIKSLRAAPYFNPAYKNTVIGYKEIPDVTAIQAAKDLRKATRGLGTKEENINFIKQVLNC